MANEDTAELEIVLRGLLISNPKVSKAHYLEREFENSESRPFPFRNLGFSSFVEYLRSIPTVVQLVPHNSPNPDVIPFSSAASSHIDKLVSKQKVTEPKRRNSAYSRRGGYNGRAPRYGSSLPPRRRPLIQCPPPLSRPAPNKVLTPFDPDFMRKILWELVKKVASSKTGVTVREIENHFTGKYKTEDFNRNGIYSGDDLLNHANNMVVRVGEKVYPQMTARPAINSYSNSGSNSYSNHDPKSNLYSSNDTTSNSYSNYNLDSYKMNCRPAPSEEDYDEYDNGFSLSEEEIGSYTIERSTQSIVDSQRNHFTPTRNEEAVQDVQDEECCRPMRNDEFNFGKGMIENFQMILDKHPGGIWATELPDKYLEEFGLILDIHSLGYTSSIEMASHLPNVFRYQRVGSHDWKLYDARLSEPFQEKTVDNTFAECYDESESFVPKSILENIKRLVEQRPSGFRSTSLHSLYMEQYHKKLDIETLGYRRFEDFLEVLKNVITVRKVTDYYLLLPKHKVVQLDAPESSEVLKIPKESIGFSGPDNVLMPNECLPSQQLPDVQYEAQSPQEPLLVLEIRVAEVISPDLFYIILDSKYNELQIMMEDLDKFYRQEESIYHIPVPYLVQNLICACTYEGTWHRAKITGFRKNDVIEIEYIDYGTPGKVKRSELRFLQCDFAKLPAQSICAKLIGIQPKNGESKWPKDACHELLRLVCEKRLLAYVYNVNTKIKVNKERLQIEVIVFDTESPVEMILNEQLVENGFADFVDKEVVPEKAVEWVKQTSTQPMDHSPSLLEDPVPVESVQWKNQISNPPVDPSTPLPAQDNLPKRTSRPPPGFEIHTVESVQPQIHPVINPAPNYTNQTNLISCFPPLYTQDHTNLVQAFNMMLAADNNTSYGLSNTPYLQQGFMPNHQVLNTPQVTTHSNSHLFPQAYMPPPNAIYNPSMIPYPPPQTNFIPSYPPGMGFPPPNAVFDPRQMHNNAVSLGYPCAQVNVPLNIQYHNNTTSQMIRKTPEINSNVRLPQNKQHHQGRNLVMQQSPSTGQAHSPASSSPRNSPLPSTFTSFKCELKEKSLCRPSPPLTPSSAEVAGIYNLTTHNIEKSTAQNNLEGFSCGSKNEPEESLQLGRLCDSISPVESRISESSKFTRVSSASGEYSSAVESIEGIKKSKAVSLCEKDLMPQSSELCESEINDKIPDSWEDIDPDDAPVKAHKFDEDFKKTLSFLEDNESYLQKNSNMFSTIITSETKIENLLLPSEKIEAPVNWKDLFNPDNIKNESIWGNKNETNKETTSSIKISVKKVLVQKLEIDNKFFHLICVNNEPAVVSHEFYAQFTTLHLHIISKIIEVKYKPFPVICKTDHPDLFVELEKVHFCGGVCKKKVLKLGRTTISYLSQVPEVFAVLNVQDKILLNTLKIISDQFNSCGEI